MMGFLKEKRAEKNKNCREDIELLGYLHFFMRKKNKSSTTNYLFDQFHQFRRLIVKQTDCLQRNWIWKVSSTCTCRTVSSLFQALSFDRLALRLLVWALSCSSFTANVLQCRKRRSACTRFLLLIVPAHFRGPIDFSKRVFLSFSSDLCSKFPLGFFMFVPSLRMLEI